jgi:peptidylprolyl isomerase
MALERKRPEIEFPEGEPPSALVVTDEIIGDGPEAASGSTVTAHYVGVAFSTGEEFDASWNRGEPLRFRLGVGQVIPGWDQGLVGKKVGSQILLVIPPDKGYGVAGKPEANIKGTDTLVFVVDILDAA